MIVLCCIIAVVLILLVSSVVVYVVITDDVLVKVGMFGLKFKTASDDEKPPKEKKAKKQKKGKPHAKKAKEVHKKKVDENTFGDMVQLVIGGIKAVIKPTEKLLSRIRLTHVNINIAVANGDADQTAIKFGQTTAVIYNVLGHLKRFIKIKIKQVDIRPDFVGDESRYDISFRVKLRLYQIFGAVLGIVFKFLANIVKITLAKKNAKNAKSDEQANSVKHTNKSK